MQQNDVLAVVSSILIALTVVAFAVIASVPGLTNPQAAPGSPPEPSCAEWTDGCVVCQRSPQGLACSTPGIACTRGPARCLRP